MKTFEDLWKLLNTFEYIWILLKTFENFWRLLKMFEDFWRLLKTIEYFWILLKTIEDYQKLLKTFEDYWRISIFGHFLILICCHTRPWLTDLTEAESSYIIGLDRPPTHPSWEWIDFYCLESLLTNQTSLTLPCPALTLPCPDTALPCPDLPCPAVLIMPHYRKWITV